MSSENHNLRSRYCLASVSASLKKHTTLSIWLHLARVAGTGFHLKFLQLTINAQAISSLNLQLELNTKKKSPAFLPFLCPRIQ